MNKKQYLKACKVSSSEELSDEQVIQYFLQGNGGIRNELAASTIKYGDFGLKPDYKEGVKLLREAFDKDKILCCFFVEGEGVETEGYEIPTSHFEMHIE